MSRNRGDNGQIEFQPERRKDSEREQHVVKQRDHRAEGERQLEPEPDIDQHQEDRDHHRDDAGLDQLAADLGPHGLDPAVAQGIAVVRAERLAHGGNGDLLGARIARLALDADEHLGGRAELLQRDLAEAEAGERAPHLPDVGLPLRPHLDQDAAGEVDAEVESAAQKHRDREHREHDGDDEEGAAQPQERDLRLVGDEPESPHDADPRAAALRAGAGAARRPG